jgi:hypothetical protein
MVAELEKRKKDRSIDYHPLSVIDLKAGLIYDATMTNYSENGMYFETNGDLHPGSEIYIGLENSPFVTYTDIRECYRAEVVWRKKLKMSYPEYGYGIKYFYTDNRKKLKGTKNLEGIDERKNPRKLYYKSIHFSANEKIWKGSSKNISSSGIYIEAKKPLPIRQRFTLALPCKANKHVIIKGEVVWSDHTGFGTKFLKIKNS